MLRKTVLIIGIIFLTFSFCSKVLARPRGGPARGDRSAYKAGKYSSQRMKIQDKKGDRQRHPVSGVQGSRHKPKAEKLHHLREQKMYKHKDDFRERMHHKGDHMPEYREHQRDKRDYLHQRHQDLKDHKKDFLDKQSDIRSSYNKPSRRLSPEQLRRLKNTDPASFRRYLENHPGVARELRNKREHKKYLHNEYRDFKEKQHDRRKRRKHIKDRLHKEGFSPKGIEGRHPGQGRGPHSGHDRGLHKGEFQGVRDHGKGVGRVKEQGFMRGQERKYRQGSRRDFPKQGDNKGPRRSRR